MTRTLSTERLIKERLPRTILRILRLIDRRLRVNTALRGLAWTAYGALGYAILAMAADFAWALPQPVRWGIWVGWLAITGGLFITRVAAPLLRKPGALALAALAERSDAELREDLTGTVALSGANGPVHGSPELIAALADVAAQRAGTVDARKVVPLRPSARQLSAAIVVLVLAAAPALVWPDPFGMLARRFFAPWAGVPRVSWYVIDVEPGDTKLAIGSDLNVSARIRSRFGNRSAATTARLEWVERTTGTAHRVAMADASSAEPGRAFAVALPGVTGSLEYRVISGSSESRRFLATAIEPPAVAAVSAHIEPPAYSKLPPVDARDSSRIEAFEGSRVALTVSATTPAQAMEVEWPSEPAYTDSVAEPDKRAVASHSLTLSADRRTGTVALVADQSGPYAIRLRSEDGLSSRPDAPRRLVVRPDAPPTLAIRGPGAGEESRPDDVLRVVIAARDDIAVASAQLHYNVERAGRSRNENDEKGESGFRDAPLTGLGSPSARGGAILELEPLGLRPGDTVTYRVRVADNRPAPRGPNVVWSTVRSLAIVASAESMLARQNQARRDALQASLNTLKKEAGDVRRETEQLRYAADAAQRGNGVWDKARQQELASREKEARAVEDHIQLFARALEADAEFHTLARPARQVADLEAEESRAMLDHARRTTDPERRLDDLRQADARLAALGERLDELQRRFDEAARRGNDDQRLTRLAEREEKLAKEAARLANAPDRARLDRVQAEQKAVENELDALLRESPELRADILSARARNADELAKRARALADRQRAEARRATDVTKLAPALKALADEQRAVEDDARRLALEVDRPLSENGRGRLNTEAIRQAVAPIEHGDLEQGRYRLEGAEGEIRRLTRDIEDTPRDLKAFAQRLVRRQDVLNAQIEEAGAEFRDRPNMTPADKAELAAKLRLLTERQAQILASLDHFVPRSTSSNARFKLLSSNPTADAVRAAADKVRHAHNGLTNGDVPVEIRARQNEARTALGRLADAVPDVWRLREPERKKLEEARRLSNEVANELERHLRETAPRPDQPYDAAAAANDLANRLGGAAQNQARAAELLAQTETEPREQPQRDRAARRAQALAEAFKTTRELASKPAEQAAFRARLPILQTEARAALDRLERKLNSQLPADDLAEELAADQRELEKGLATPAARAGLVADQRRIASALRNLDVPDASLAKEEAIRVTERAARALAEVKAGASLRNELRDAVEGVEALVQRLTDSPAPRAAVAALARAQRALNDPAMGADPESAERRQRAILDELARLPSELRNDAVEASSRAAELAERARRPSQDDPVPLRPTPTAVAHARARAADAIDRLAARLPAETAKPPQKKPDSDAPADPELGLKTSHLERAAELAQRERRVRERLQALLADRIGPQQDLRRESAALGQEVAALRDELRGISDRAQGPAQAAAQLLGEEAPRGMDRGTEHLSAGRVAPARDEQRRAAETVERGAQQAEDLAAALRADRPMEASPEAEGDPRAVGDARAAVREAARKLGQARDPAQGHADEHLKAAGQAMHEAARDIRTAAQAIQGRGDQPANGEEMAAQDDSPPTQPGGPTRDPKSAPAGKADADLAQLKEMVRRKTGRAWGELPGHLRTEILQMSQGRYRDDYARLIQLYFREIAAGASADGQDLKP